MKSISKWLFITELSVLLIFSTFKFLHAAPVVQKIYARDVGSGNFTGFKVSYTVPSNDALLRNTNYGCINYPVWIRYPGGQWVEIGISKCYTDPANTYHLYGGSLAGGQWQWAPNLSDQVSLGQSIILEVRKTNSTTWGFYVNNVLRSTRTHSDFGVNTSGVEYGIESDSAAFQSYTSYFNTISYQTSIGGAYANKNWWNPSQNDAVPERFYINGQASSPNSWVWSYGLPAITNWDGASAFEIGLKNVLVSVAWDNRHAEDYSGIQGIDRIYNITTPDGQTAGYGAGWHTGDRSEFIMQVPTNPFWLYIIGIADRPAPVIFNIYVDGTYRGQMSLANNDNNRHLVIGSFNISGLEVSGRHTIGVEFANDSYQPGSPDTDRNYYLDLVAITPPQ